ncbi:ABC transporter permease [Humitalea sp. 24SJ18S-53]|uniref:ABC transporter permease n=1 Tax=Humitalea sp. 24SJ18S-53 TaxID=3422307 RepID=UPI003D67A0B5
MSAASETAALPRRAVARPDRRWRLVRDRVLLFAVILAAWESAGVFGVDPIWISRPSLIAERLWSLALTGELFRHAGRTVTEAGLGLTLAFVVGVPIGVAMARYKYANAVAEPLVLGLYSLPRVALAPLFIIWFGIDLFSKVMMAFSTVLFVFMLNVHEGLKTVDRDLVDLFRTMRASPGFITRRVLLAWVVPWMIAGLRLGVGLSLIGAVVAELIGSSAGLGWYIERAGGHLDTTGVFAGLVALMVIAMLGNAVVALLERRFSAWRSA